jgi:hypothetical protein
MIEMYLETIYFFFKMFASFIGAFIDDSVKITGDLRWCAIKKLRYI